MTSISENYSDNFCLDFSIDFCDGTPTSQLRAIIDDPGLAGDGVSSIFGTNKGQFNLKRSFNSKFKYVYNSNQ
jgi:hypothetical protein